MANPLHYDNVAILFCLLLCFLKVLRSSSSIFLLIIASPWLHPQVLTAVQGKDVFVTDRKDSSTQVLPNCCQTHPWYVFLVFVEKALVQGCNNGNLGSMFVGS